MERGYHPDGWLGMILGSKLFYDFSGKYKFEDKFDGLVKELDRRYNKQPSPSGGGDFVDSPISQVSCGGCRARSSGLYRGGGGAVND